MERRGLGWRRDKPDPRDFDARVKLGAGEVPVSASAQQFIVEVLDQGALSACVAHGVTQAVRARQVFQGIAEPSLGSRMVAYWIGRKAIGEQSLDAGCFARDVYAGYLAVGFPPESAWPYSDSDQRYALEPPAEAWREAYDQRGGSYHRIMSTGEDRLLDVKRAIAAGHVVTFGTMVSEDFCGNVNTTTGPIDPPIGVPIAGGHELCITGYDGDNFEILNSWSTSWGRDGYCTFSGAYLTWDQTDDAWLVEVAPKFSGTKP